MKNQKFNIKLYIDGIKQLKLIGIMSTVILSVFSILIPIGYLMSSMYRDETGRLILSPETVTMSQVTPVNYAIFLLIVPIMFLSLFSFLTKRNACDFYHSIPLKREGIYLSFYASVMTWAIGMLTLSSLLAVITIAIIPNISIVASSIFIFYLKILAASVLVSGGFMIAVSLTGTTFTNLVVAVIVLFFPRIFIAATSLMINGTLPYINLSSNGLLLNYHNNLLISTFTGLFGSSKYNLIWGPIAYSFILGAIYVIIGCFLFMKRKSEAAGNAAITKGLQLIFRLSVSFIICLIPCYIIYSVIVGHTKIYELDFSTIFSIIVLYVIALIAYFLYELITTKKLKNLAKALPGVGILILLNAAFLAFLSIGTFVLKNSLPDVEDIRYFNICPDSNVYDENNYFSELSSEIKITDETAIESIAALLKATAQKCDENPNYLYYNNYKTLNIRIKTGILRQNYTIALTENEYNTLLGFLKNNNDYMALYTKLPPADENYTNANTYDTFSPETNKQIYESARREIAEMDFETAYNYINNYYGSSENSINVTTVSGIEQYSFEIPISKMLPETYALYIAAYNKLYDCEALTGILKDWYSNSAAQKYDASEIIYFSEGLNLNDSSNDIYINIYYSGDSYNNKFETTEAPDTKELELVSSLAEHISAADGNINVSNTNILYICFNSYAEILQKPNYINKNYEGYYAVDDEGMDIINQLNEYQMKKYDTEIYE